MGSDKISNWIIHVDPYLSEYSLFPIQTYQNLALKQNFTDCYHYFFKLLISKYLERHCLTDRKNCILDFRRNFHLNFLSDSHQPLQ